MDRQELADFLRSRRERVTPADVGIEAGGRRRTPGLRREEVAWLAGMSVDYYARLEQARGPHPSRQVLGALARALRLSEAERNYLHHLAGEPPKPPPGPPRDVPQGVLRLLDRLDDVPAFVLDAKYDVLAWNPMAAALIADFSTWPANRRNLLWQSITASPARARYDEEAARQFGREIVGDLRAASARYPDDPGIAELIAALLDFSPEFAEMWARHEVHVRTSTTKVMDHPQVGRLDLDCEVLDIPQRDQRLVLYTAAPGTASYDALQLLRVTGTQTLSTP